jgi:hypothetical protein
MVRPKLTPEIAFNLAKALYEASGGRDDRLESVIGQSPRYNFYYCRDVIKAPWPDFEKYLLQSAEYAYWYTRFVLDAPWPEAEPVIAQDAAFSSMYTSLVIKTPEDRARFKEVQRWVALS